MEEFNFDSIASWLETTEQQFQIIKTIYRLEGRETEITPKNIGKEYEKIYGKSIQKPNLFTILRTLGEKELIKRDSTSNYKIDFDGVRQTLEKHQNKLEKEREEFQKAYTKTEDYFKRHISRSEYPTINYYEQKELYVEMLKSIKTSNTLYIITDFPSIAYTYNLATGVDNLEYIETLWKRCFKEKNLDISYLTTLNTDYLFSQAFRTTQDPKIAFTECELVLQQLVSQGESYKKLKVRVVEEQKGMDVLIPIRDKPTEVFQFIKDEHKEILGGIKIRSAETAMQAENMFKQGFNHAEDMNNKLMQKAHKKLKLEYGILE
ncbi:MAG: hypothetical protein FJY77_01770 [Candidatus Altiarchaeales archaeon]|nr:hypothetical protein [Candidatus Altiarchaeales archaeon]